ncbi:MAG: metallophosphoesterase [Paracoccaceae bacterium]
MKVLAFSDLHRDKDAATALVAASAEADVVVGTGDFATKRIGAAETLEILAQCRVPVILTHGNHDDPDEVQRICSKNPNLHYLHGTSMTVGGVSFFGLGGEIPSRNTFSWNAAETEEHAAQMLQKCPSDAVLVTHTPPYGIADLQKNGDHEGSDAILKAAQSNKLKILLCGHIHHAWGSSGQIGTTAVQNLGPTINWFEL